MNDATEVDRRRHVRYPLATSVEFYHGPSRRRFPARSADVSGGGMLMYVPAGTPVSVGESVRLTVGSGGRPEFAGLSDKPMEATIVRVERGGILGSGHLPIGIRFNRPVA